MEWNHNKVASTANIGEFSLFGSLHGDLSEDRVSVDEVQDALQKFEKPVSAGADSGEEGFGSVDVSFEPDRDDGLLDEEDEPDLSAGEMGQGPDPVRLYM